jgi:hypothetical protein
VHSERTVQLADGKVRAFPEARLFLTIGDLRTRRLFPVVVDSDLLGLDFLKTTDFFWKSETFLLTERAAPVPVPMEPPRRLPTQTTASGPNAVALAPAAAAAAPTDVKGAPPAFVARSTAGKPLPQPAPVPGRAVHLPGYLPLRLCLSRKRLRLLLTRSPKWGADAVPDYFFDCPVSTASLKALPKTSVSNEHKLNGNGTEKGRSRHATTR